MLRAPAANQHTCVNWTTTHARALPGPNVQGVTWFMRRVRLCAPSVCACACVCVCRILRLQKKLFLWLEGTVTVTLPLAPDFPVCPRLLTPNAVDFTPDCEPDHCLVCLIALQWLVEIA